MKRVLIVDDEPAMVSALRRVMRRVAPGLAIDSETDPVLALARVRRTPYAVVISDLRMPELDGVGLLAFVATMQPRAVRVLLTASGEIDDARRAINEAGVFRYLAKPWDERTLVLQLRAALEAADEAFAPKQEARTALADAGF